MKFFTRQSVHLLSLIAKSVFAFFLIYAVQAVAADLEFTPSLAISETFTDDVRLGAGLNAVTGGGGGGGLGFGGVGSGGSDLVTQINPGLLLNGTGKHFDINAQYFMNNLIYAKNNELTRIRHMLDATATAEVLKDLFFIDGDARILQQNISLLGPQTTSNVFVTGNRANLQTYSVSPYLRYRFQNFATTELRYTRGIVKSGANGFFNSERDSFLVNLNSGSSFTKLTWGLNYSNQMIHLNAANRTIELERTIANFRYNWNRRFALTATGGYERNSFVSIRGKNSSPTWTVGFIWAPNRRTDIQFNGGQRFFGQTYSGEVNYRARLSTWRVLYAEDITTLNQQAGQFDGFGALNINAFDGLGFQNALLGLNNFLTNRVFLQKRFNASVSLNGSKNDITLNLFQLIRKPYTDGDFDVDLLGGVFFNDTKQIGGNATWRYRFSPNTDFNVNFSFIRFDFLSTNNTTNNTTDNLILTANLTKNFTPNLIGLLQFQRIDRLTNNRSGGQDIDLSANAVTVSLTKNF